MSGKAPPSRRDPAWIGRLFWLTVALLLAWPLLRATEFRPAALVDEQALRVAGRFVGDFLPPRLDLEFLRPLLADTWRTVAMATAGVTLGLLLALPLALASVASLSVSSLRGRMAPLPFALRQLARWTAMALRSVPELVWALVFVRVVGLGPTAGVLAIALSYGGMLGKVYADILESGDAAPTQALLRNGSGRLQAFFYALLPANAGELASYTVYRWECAIRSSVILGFVGAGGLGQRMDESMKMFAGAEVATMLLIFMGLVALADRVSRWLRESLA